MRVEENENVDDFLEHFGVKGMKWGVRKAASSDSGSSDGKSQRQRNRELNKASRINDRINDRKEIESARRRHYGGENAKRIADAKAKYKEDKVTVGSREARKQLDQVRALAYADALKSKEYLNGKEFAKDLALTMLIPDRTGNGAAVVREIGLQRKYGKKN